MSSYRKTMPSFTLVLTSGHPSIRSPTIQPSSAMLPIAPNFLTSGHPSFRPPTIQPSSAMLPTSPDFFTSGHPSFLPPTIQPSSAMLPTAPDFLMNTIDLRRHSADANFDEGRDEDVDSQPIFEAEQKSSNSLKRKFLFLLHKLVSYKQKFVTGKTDGLPSPN